MPPVIDVIAVLPSLFERNFVSQSLCDMCCCAAPVWLACARWPSLMRRRDFEGECRVVHGAAENAQAKLGRHGVCVDDRVALNIALRLFDALVVPAAAAMAYFVFSGAEAPSPLARMAFGVHLLNVAVCFTVIPVYRRWWLRGFAADTGLLLLAWSVAFAAFVVYVRLSGMESSASDSWLMLWYVIGGLMLVLSRAAVRVQLHRLRSRGLDYERVLLIGLRAPALKLHRLFAGKPEIGKKVIGYFSSGDDVSLRAAAAPPRLGGLEELAGYMERHRGEFDQVWVSLPLSGAAPVRAVLKEIERFPVPVRLIPDISGLGMLNPGVHFAADVPMIGIRQGLVTQDYRVIKRVLDLMVAVTALILLMPLLVLLAVVVKLTSVGPALFRQRRHGLGGQEFWMLKFRSMHVHQDVPGQVTQASRNDPRVTRVGAFLRRTSLDELPQLFNVLGGSMSVVGPRPHAIQHNSHYERLIGRYMHRHYVKPGITGWAQVHGLRGETPDLRSMKKRVQYDIDYIRRWSPILDLRIIALTAVKVLGQKTAY